MPIFEYLCDSCGHCFEQLIFKKDNKKVNCPECGKTKIRKLISCASILGDSAFGKCESGSSSGSSGFS